MIQEKYKNLIYEFHKLDMIDKKEEIINNMKELLQVLYTYNRNVINDNMLPVLSNYENDDEFLDMLFTYVISLKEENAKFIDNINNI